jgi:predicted transcriptional regulator
MALRLDADLKERFQRAADAQDRPAGQLLREIMRDYLDQRESSDQGSREAAARYATASVALEGGQFSSFSDGLVSRYVEGNLDVPGMVETLIANRDKL